MSGVSKFLGLVETGSRTLISRASVAMSSSASSVSIPLLSSALHAPRMPDLPERLKALAPPVEAPARPAEPSALAVRPQPQSQMVPYGHRFVPVEAKHLSGMQPDSIAHTVIPKGTRLTQMQVPGGPQGEWYSPKPGQTPEQLGISRAGMMRVFEMGPGTPLPPIPLPNGQGVMLPGAESWVPALKRATTFEALTDVPAVSSVARPIVDTWSLTGVPVPARGGGKPSWSPFQAGVTVPTSGGGQQLLSPFRSRFRQVSDASPSMPAPKPVSKPSGDEG